MPFSAFGLDSPTAPIGELGVVSIRVEGLEFKTIKDFVLSQHFLTPTDPFRLTIASELTAKEALEKLVAGSKVEIFIDDAKQFAGYIEVIEVMVDRHGGTTIHLQGRDTMAPVVFSQVDPDHHYPDKTPLETLLRQLLEPFGFTKFQIANDDNVAVAANLALKQKRGSSKHHRQRRAAPKALHQYPLAKCKPEHNDSFYQFISRILNRLGLWMWPSVDGETIIVGQPNYEQDPIGQLRRFVSQPTGGFGRSAGVSLDRGTTNIESGGIRLDTSEQPSFIVARGEIPPTAQAHTRTRTVIANPLLADIEQTVGFSNVVARVLNPEAQTTANPSLAAAHEKGTFNSLLERYITEKETYTTLIKAQPVQLPNPFASKVARPIYMKDKHSTTPEQLEKFARRQMSLFVRKAFVAKYTFVGFYLDGAIPQPDTIVSVIDESSGFDGNLWVQSRTITQSREAGTRTELELIPIGALSF